jgi:ssDNA-binding replication factor A large subunit
MLALYDIEESMQLEETMWTPISGLTVESRAMNVRFCVINRGTPRQVTSRATGRFHLVSDCVVGDETGIITLTLWNDDINDIQLDKTYELLNGQINMFDECMSLSKGRWGKIRVASLEVIQVDSTTNMSRPFMGRPKRRKHARSSTGRTFQGTPGRESKGYCSRKGF